MADEQKQEKRKVLVKIGEKVLDAGDLPPFTIGDRIALNKQGVDTTNMRGNPEIEAKFVLFALQKLDPSLTLDAVLTLPYAKCVQLTIEYLSKGVELDTPFSTPSTNSPGTTSGTGTA